MKVARVYFNVHVNDDYDSVELAGDIRRRFQDDVRLVGQEFSQLCSEPLLSTVHVETIGPVIGKDEVVELSCFKVKVRHGWIQQEGSTWMQLPIDEEGLLDQFVYEMCGHVIMAASDRRIVRSCLSVGDIENLIVLNDRLIERGVESAVGAVFYPNLGVYFSDMLDSVSIGSLLQGRLWHDRRFENQEWRDFVSVVLDNVSDSVSGIFRSVGFVVELKRAIKGRSLAAMEDRMRIVKRYLSTGYKSLLTLGVIAGLKELMFGYQVKQVLWFPLPLPEEYATIVQNVITNNLSLIGLKDCDGLVSSAISAGFDGLLALDDAMQAYNVKPS